MELEDLFEQNDVKNACEKLKALQKSLTAQIGLPGQSEREAQIEGFKNHLEALASTAVVQCFTNGDLEQSKYFVKIFSNMDRSPQLVQHYLSVQKGILQQHWIETVELSQNSNSTIFFREFYDYLYEYFQKQQKWCLAVFGEIHAPILVLIETLPNLNPSRENTVISCLKRNDDKLTTLYDISTANIYFGRLFIEYFMSHESVNLDLVTQFCSAVLDYFITFIGQTASFEQQWLSSRLSEMTLIHPTANESVRAIGNAVGKIFGWIDETLKRCQVITQNCGLPATIIVINVSMRVQVLHISRCEI